MLSAQHLRQCWQAPIDLPNPERLIVVVQFNLAPDGTLNGAPRVTSPQNYRNDAPMRTAAERAVTAVERCSPYPFVNDPELANHYEAWGDLEFTFAPRP